jgi:hypothetical protein
VCIRYRERSELSYLPYLRQESSVSTINHREESSFGFDAVSFKNSLVYERESMKRVGKRKIELSIKTKNWVNISEIEPNVHSINLKNNNKLNSELSKTKIQSGKPRSCTPTFVIETGLNNEHCIKKEVPPQAGIRSSSTTRFNCEVPKPVAELPVDRYKLNFYNSFNENFPHNPSKPEHYPTTINYPTSISMLNSTVNARESMQSRNEAVGQCWGEMPVRDVGLDPLAKLRMKNGNSILLKVTKDQPSPQKQFASIAKK